MGRITLTPLTAEEQVFAAEHHNLVYRYLHIRKLPIEKWYDAVIFSYLQAVKKWFVRPKIQTYQFSTIACNSMRAAIGNEQKRQARQIQTISLDEGITGAEGLTYSDTITSENLRYIPYITYGEEMNIKYNVKLPERKGTGRKKSEEILAIEDFLAKNRENMCLEYENTEEAKKKHNSIQTNRRRKNHQELYDLYRVENCIYVVRLKEIKGGKKK